MAFSHMFTHKSYITSTGANFSQEILSIAAWPKFHLLLGLEHMIKVLSNSLLHYINNMSL